MTMADVVFITLLIWAILQLVISIFLFVGGMLAWHEVVFMRKNGLTWAIGSVLHGVGLVLLMNSAMAFYASLASLETITFLIMAWFGNAGMVLLFYTCYRVVVALMTPEEGNE